MSFTELLENLEILTPERRKMVIQRAFELEEPMLTTEQAKLVEERLRQYRRSPESFITSMMWKNVSSLPKAHEMAACSSPASGR
jgi:uncharacterized protein Smg (DUF494 family)